MVGVAAFPGSAVDEILYLFRSILGIEAKSIGSEQEQFGDIRLLVVPGGASYGDVLRPGALAKSAPLSAGIRRFARSGKVLGIGNGFQILCELGILPGTLLPNIEGRFLEQDVYVQVQETMCALVGSALVGAQLRLPIASTHGCYFADNRTILGLQERKGIVMRYVSESGALLENAITGSARGIAAVTNESGNVLGMMVHPERAAEEIFGNSDGRRFMDALVASL